MAVRNYSNITNVGSLSGAIGTGETTLPISGGWSNLPAFPFYIIVDRGNALEECMLATGGNATALDVTRGYDGSPASSHGTSATVEHAVLAEFFNKADQHVEASTNVHGLSGGAAVVGTSQTQTLTNKTINASIVSLAHSTSPAATQAVQVAADAATARDGFVWSKTAGATGAAFKAVSTGTTRFTVDADGKVQLNSTTGSDKALSIQQSGTERTFIQNDGTADFGLQAASSAGDRVTIRTRPTQSPLLIKDESAANLFTVGPTGNVVAAGSVAAASASTTGTVSVGSNLTVTGTSTLTGDATLPLPAAGTTPRINVRGRTGGLLIEGRDQANTVTYTLGVDGGGVANAKWFIHDKSSPVVAMVGGTGVVPFPTTNMLVFDGSDNTLKRYNGATWDIVGRYGTHYSGTTAVLDGQLRTTNAAATSGTTELLVLDTGAVSLPANSCFKVDVFLVWDSSAAGDDYDVRIRETNISGTVRQETITPRTDNLVPYRYSTSVIHTTTTADTKTFVATIQRINGSGTATVKATSYILVTYLGPSSLISTV